MQWILCKGRDEVRFYPMFDRYYYVMVEPNCVGVFDGGFWDERECTHKDFNLVCTTFRDAVSQMERIIKERENYQFKEIVR